MKFTSIGRQISDLIDECARDRRLSEVQWSLEQALNEVELAIDDARDEREENDQNMAKDREGQDA